MATCGDVKMCVLSPASDFESMAFFTDENFAVKQKLYPTKHRMYRCTAYRLHESLPLLHDVHVPENTVGNERQKSTMSLLFDSAGSQSINAGILFLLLSAPGLLPHIL